MSRDELLQGLREKARLLRRHSLESTSEAGSGHPTSCCSAADLVAALYFHAMRFDPKDPAHPLNDQFLLSKGHAAPVLYAALAEAGSISTDRLSTLRRFGSELEGHPTPRSPFSKVATGSLGQGLSVSTGIALSALYLEKADIRIYVLMGDGEAAEGGVWEAAHIASYYKLHNLVGIIDVNRLGQSQQTQLEWDVETFRRRFEDFGWHSVAVDGHDMGQIVDALDQSREVKDRPSMIVARTVKGKGVSFFEGKDGWHGKPLKKGEQLAQALAELERNFSGAGLKVKRPPAPQDGHTIKAPNEIPSLEAPDYKLGQSVATREAYGAALVKLGDASEAVVALDGDTKNSTFAQEFFERHPGRFFESFIAEQNMVGAAVGLSTRGKIPFVSTFACFLCRAYDHIRMSAISRANIKLVGSHCGVSIGEDGPSQMGLEDLAMMRAVGGSVVLYPSDAVATERLVAEAAHHSGIVYLRTTRPKAPVLYSNDETFPIGGAKVLRSSEKDAVTVVGAGITLHEALQAHEELAGQEIAVRIRVIDAYSVKPVAGDLLLEAARKTRKKVLVVEDHYSEGGLGDAVLDALGPYGIQVHKLAVREVPLSGKAAELMKWAGIDAASISAAVRKLISE